MMESPAVAASLARSLAHKRVPVIIARIITGGHSICHVDNLIGGAPHYATGRLLSFGVFQQLLQLQGCNWSSCKGPVIEPRRQDGTGGRRFYCSCYDGSELSRTKNKLTSEACFFFRFFCLPAASQPQSSAALLKCNQNSERKSLG